MKKSLNFNALGANRSAEFYLTVAQAAIMELYGADKVCSGWRMTAESFRTWAYAHRQGEYRYDVSIDFNSGTIEVEQIFVN